VEGDPAGDAELSGIAPQTGRTNEINVDAESIRPSERIKNNDMW